MVEFMVWKFILFLDESLLYKDANLFEQYTKLGALIIWFYNNYFKELRQNELKRVLKIYLKSINDLILLGNPFWALFDVLTNQDLTEKFIGNEELLMI